MSESRPVYYDTYFLGEGPQPPPSPPPTGDECGCEECQR